MTQIPAGSPFETLHQETCWSGWRIESRVDKKTGEKKSTKVPYSPGRGTHARSNDPSTWGSHADALAMRGVDGIGFMVGGHESVLGFDLDHCRDAATGSLEPWAAEFVAHADSYTEISPSGTGLHILGVDPHKPQRDGFVLQRGPNGQKIEVFLGAGHFLTITGQIHGDAKPLNDVGHVLAELIAERDARDSRGAEPQAAGDPDTSLSWLSKDIVTLILKGAPAGADRSKELFRVVGELREIGWSSARIVNVLRAHPEGIAARCFERGKDDVDRQVRLCLRKIDDHIAARRCAAPPPPPPPPGGGTSPPEPETGAWAGEGASWDDPDTSPVDDRRDELPDFPLGIFNKDWQQWIETAAHGAGVTVGYVAMPLLGVAGGLIGTARLVRPAPAWLEPQALWVANVGFSGSGKTPGLDCLRRPLGLLDRERRDHIDALRRAHETRTSAAKSERKAWEQAVADAVASGSQPPVMPASATDPGQFVAPRLSVTDATIERLVVLLQAQPRGMLLIVDELRGWLANLKRYNRGSDREFFIEAWNGRPYIVERMGRPPVVLDHLLIGVVGGIQPDKLASMLAGDSDGLHARILFSWPEEAPHRSLSDTAPEAAPFILNALRRLILLPAGTTALLEPITLPLTAEALAAFEQFRQQHYDGKHVLEGRERETWAKAQNYVLRLAGVLAHLDWAGGLRGNNFAVGPEPREIEARFISAAADLWHAYLWPHARAAIRQIGLNDRHVELRRILHWARAMGAAELSFRDVQRRALGRRFDAGQTEKFINELIKAGWLRELVTATGGRPLRRWEVNPSLLSQSGHKAQKAQKS